LLIHFTPFEIVIYYRCQDEKCQPKTKVDHYIKECNKYQGELSKLQVSSKNEIDKMENKNADINIKSETEKVENKEIDIVFSKKNNDVDNKNYEVLPEDYSSYDLSFKIIVIGNSGVGKSCLSIQATKHEFENNYIATIGFEFFSFNVKFKDKVIRLQIWDTCGQEIYKSLVSSFYRSSSLAIVVYSIDNQKSFDDIDLWLKDLKANSSPDIKVFLIGNKADLEEKRVISKEKAEKYKEEYELDFFKETSAKTGMNAQEIFVEAAIVLYNDFHLLYLHELMLLMKEHCDYWYIWYILK